MGPREPGDTAQILLEKCLSTIDEYNPSLRAVIRVMAEASREAAVAADRAWARGDWLGLLHGVPVSLKDVFPLVDTPTTNGSAYYGKAVASEDAPLVGLLRQSGALLHAKDNMSELECGATNQNLTFGNCRNPWDLDRLPGGSSGGSAVAVAAGMTVLAIGTDVGGSIRVPAALNGVTGVRPTLGRLTHARGGEARPTMADFATPGPIARRVTDAARAFAVLDRDLRDDPTSVPGPRDNVLLSLSNDVRGLRVGVPSSPFFEACEDGVASTVTVALRELQKLGMTLIDVELRDVEHVHEILKTLVLPQHAALSRDRLDREPDTFDPEVHEWLRLGSDTSAATYVNAEHWRKEWKRTTNVAFGTVDIIATPTVPITAPLAGDSGMIETTQALTRNTYAWSLADLPTISVPCGFANGLPVGLQLTGAPWCDSTVFKVAAAFQRRTDWHIAIPPHGLGLYS